MIQIMLWGSKVRIFYLIIKCKSRINYRDLTRLLKQVRIIISPQFSNFVFLSRNFPPYWRWKRCKALIQTLKSCQSSRRGKKANYTSVSDEQRSTLFLVLIYSFCTVSSWSFYAPFWLKKVLNLPLRKEWVFL